MLWLNSMFARATAAVDVVRSLLDFSVVVLIAAVVDGGSGVYRGSVSLLKRTEQRLRQGETSASDKYSDDGSSKRPARLKGGGRDRRVIHVSGLYFFLDETK